ncbi:glutamine-hydrolyzing carbamoyl-phosphate synthase small subunit [Candidatus Pelagibacter communis]|uniref:glutamine-hydrolyzing carbamoyl-phosphate synthase small subunit n=1 Tax=Pelagibacter ubique TaxID=198252 RepID=UPI00092CF8AC|nr:glutamine-hydrolyzing carbamoyl-phosphate synthase small subunit [Candidatus Pelagibacter ubique]
MNKKSKKTNSKIKSQINTGVLVLENKKVFKGIGIGYQGEATGEVCFNTSLTGYQEIISDPSYAGQIINFTFPHIGNVGTNKEDHESDKIWARGVIINSEITSPSNYRSFLHLDTWLKKNKIIGITGLDTRSLTNFIRDKSAPKGTISFSKKGKFNINKLTNTTIKWSGLKNLDLAEVVSTKKNYIWKGLKTWKKDLGYKKNNKNSFHVVAIDYGIKKNILRYFSDFNCKVTVVSCKTSAQKILSLKPNGIFLSNGPGDPAATGKYAIEIIKELIKKNLPIFGICLGHQILALALGGKTKKMKLGHRGANHPVKNIIHDNVEITSQNHGFEVVKETLPKSIEVTHKSLFDNSIEGIKLKNKPVFSVQYHPESNPGPQDSVYLFKEFINNMKKNAKKKRS